MGIVTFLGGVRATIFAALAAILAGLLLWLSIDLHWTEADLKAARADYKLAHDNEETLKAAVASQNQAIDSLKKDSEEKLQAAREELAKKKPLILVREKEVKVFRNSGVNDCHEAAEIVRKQLGGGHE